MGHDITDRVTLHQNTLAISGALIKEIGLSAASPGDESDPGMVMLIR